MAEIKIQSISFPLTTLPCDILGETQELFSLCPKILANTLVRSNVAQIIIKIFKKITIIKGSREILESKLIDSSSAKIV